MSLENSSGVSLGDILGEATNWTGQILLEREKRKTAEALAASPPPVAPPAASSGSGLGSGFAAIKPAWVFGGIGVALVLILLLRRR